jgi:hypothetical protein
MEILGTAFLIGTGMFLNNKSQPEKKDPVLIRPDSPNKSTLPTPQVKLNTPAPSPINDPNDVRNANRTFRLQFFKKKEITNPNFDETALWKDVGKDTMERIKSRIDLSKSPSVNQHINDVGFDSNNLSNYDNNAQLPSIDDMDRDVQFIHNNMVPFYGATVKQNVNDSATTQHILETFTGNFRHSRRDNKAEVENLFDPTPNNQLVYGANSNAATNRDQSRFFPSATGKRNNDLPFEQIQVGPGVADGYTARPSGGFNPDVRILPKTTEELMVNPKISYEGRINAGKAVTEKGKIIGQQIIKKPKAIMYNWNGERNFTGLSTHKKNKQRPDIIMKCTTRDKLHQEYTGIAAPTRKSKSTPESLRGKNKLGTKKTFANDYGRNLTQATGKGMNDLGKSGIENRETERSMQSTRVHYTNVHQVGGSRGQQYNFNLEGGMRYTRKQDTIENPTNISGKSGPNLTSKGGKVYDKDQTAKNTIRETTEDNRHHGFVGKHTLKGPTYDQSQTAKVTIRETNEDNNHRGFINSGATMKGRTYDQNETARVTVKETTEDNNHHGFVGKHTLKGQVYDKNQTAKVTIRETTENNNHQGYVNTGATMKGRVYDQNQTAKVTVKETTEDNRHIGFIGKHKLKGKVFNSSETAKVTIRETTEDNKYVPGVNSGTLQNGGAYMTTKMEAKNPQKAYLCDNEYVGTAGATTNKKARSYSSEYNVNTNKEQIAVGRAPNEVKNSINAGKEFINLCINKIEMDQEVPHLIGKGTSLGNMYLPQTPCNLTSRKNVTPRQVDRLQVDVLDNFKNNPLQINQNIN